MIVKQKNSKFSHQYGRFSDHFANSANSLCVISSPELKAHRSAYSIPMVRRPSSVRPSVVRRRPQCSKIFFSKTTGPIKAKFYVEPPWVEGTIFCSRHLGHMTKMTAMPIYCKNPSKFFFSRTGGPIFTKLGR